MNLAKQSTAKTFLLGPILDSAGVAKTDGVVASIKVTKNGSVGAVDAEDTLTHNHTGHYVFVSDGGDFDTLGEVEFSLNSGTNALAPVKFQVVPATVYDAFITNVMGAAGGFQIVGSNAATTFATLTSTGAFTTGSIVNSGVLTQTGAVTLTGGINAGAVSGTLANDLITAASLKADAVTKIIDDFETQSNADPTGFKVNVMEINGTAQTAGDVGAKTGFSLAATGADLILKSSTFIQAIAAAINELATYGLTALYALITKRRYKGRDRFA